MASRHRPHSAAEWAQLGQRLREARMGAGLTQVEVANRIGLPQPAIANVESGERQVTALELRDLCRIYRVSSGSVLDDHGTS